MPRKRAPTFDAQRADILAAAAHLFAEQGFSAASMNQVAEACGVAKPTLYHYFQDKQALLAQICDSHVHALLVTGRGASETLLLPLFVRDLPVELVDLRAKIAHPLLPGELPRRDRAGRRRT